MLLARHPRLVVVISLYSDSRFFVTFPRVFNIVALASIISGQYAGSSQNQGLCNRFVAVAAAEVESCLSVAGRQIHLGAIVEEAKGRRNVPITAGGQQRGVARWTYPVHI